MFSFFCTRRSIYFNISLIFLLIVVWCVAYMHPVLRSFFKEEHLFYGKVSYAAMPSIFGGSNIPFLDKTIFQINGDTDATFYLYASQEIMEDMSDWFNFAARNASDVPLEISAVRISSDRYIVKSMASTYGDLDWETVGEYHVYYSLVGLGIVLVAFIGWLVFVLLAIYATMKRKRAQAIPVEDGCVSS